MWWYWSTSPWKPKFVELFDLLLIFCKSSQLLLNSNHLRLHGNDVHERGNYFDIAMFSESSRLEVNGSCWSYRQGKNTISWRLGKGAKTHFWCIEYYVEGVVVYNLWKIHFDPSHKRCFTLNCVRSTQAIEVKYFVLFFSKKRKLNACLSVSREFCPLCHIRLRCWVRHGHSCVPACVLPSRTIL